MNELKAVIVDIISGVSEIDISLRDNLVWMAPLANGWHLNTYDEERDDDRRLSKRLKAWTQLNAKMTSNDKEHMHAVTAVAKGVEYISGIRHNLAHGRLEFSDSAFGPLVGCTVARPLWHRMPQFAHMPDEESNARVIYQHSDLMLLPAAASVIAQHIRRLFPQARMIQKPSLRGTAPKREGQ